MDLSLLAKGNLTLCEAEKAVLFWFRNGFTFSLGNPQWQNATYLFEVTTWVWTDDLDLDGNWWQGDTWDGTLADCDPGEVTVYTDVWVFDIPELQDYWWGVTNTGIRLMQVRFYPVLANGS